MSRGERIATVLATAGGAGFVPQAPGTAGSLVGVALYVLVSHSGASWIYLPLLATLLIAGIWAAGRVEAIYGHDASQIVIDEVVGQMLTLSFATRTDSRSVAVGVILGFLLFRFFDILKPFPIRRLEGLSGGIGVMADDVGAGLYALIVLLIAEPLAAEIL